MEPSLHVHVRAFETVPNGFGDMIQRLCNLPIPSLLDGEFTAQLLGLSKQQSDAA